MHLPYFPNITTEIIYSNLFNIYLDFPEYKNKKHINQLKDLIFKFNPDDNNIFYVYCNILDQQTNTLDIISELKEDKIVGNMKIRYKDKEDKDIFLIMKNNITIERYDINIDYSETDCLIATVRISCEETIYENRMDVVKNRITKINKLKNK
jgi:hypothetical protein